jgi:NADPH:quinone reductase-like Zn-dependent oxidoreductase
MLGYVTDPGAPGGLDRRELPAPEPGPHDVLVDVRAYAINRGELSLLEQRSDGWQPGQDLAGVVARAAADGTGPLAGTRVVGAADGGGWSQQAIVPSHRVAALPDEVSFADAAALPVAGLTALRALRAGGDTLGRRVLVTGATGGVGSFAVQLAVAGGAHVTALVSSESRTEAAKALGAHAVVTKLDDDAGRFDTALDGVGGTVLRDAIQRLRDRGTVVAYGVAGGGGPTPLAFYDFAGPPALGRLVAFFIYATGEQTFGDDLAALAGMIADGRLRVARDATRGWDETLDALEDLREHRVTGKVVLTLEAD